MGIRQIAPVGLVLALTVAGYLGARELGERDARHVSTDRAAVAAAQVHGRVIEAADLTESLRRFLVGHVGVTTAEFADLGTSLLNAVDLAAAAWIEPVPARERAEYERRVGHTIVVTTRSNSTTSAGSRASYLPATLVTGYPPAVVPGVDLGREPGVAAAAARPATLYRVSATPEVRLSDGTVGLFLVESAQRVTGSGIYSGYVVLFVPHSWLLAAAEQAGAQSAPQIRVGETAHREPGRAAATQSSFTAFGERFDVFVPNASIPGDAVLLQWIILGCGLVLAVFAGALGVNAARRARAQRELDHIFNLTPDLIAVADFNGYFKRINPAFKPTLGYTAEELLSRPLIEFVHPDDRERTLAELEAIAQGRTTVSFENRYVGKDGSPRWLQWSATPVLKEGQMYAVARDVTERRRAEAELRAAEERYRSLAAEQAALRRVATLVASGTPPADVLAAVAQEAGGVLGAGVIEVCRFEPDGTAAVVSRWTADGDHASLSPSDSNGADGSGTTGAGAHEQRVRSTVTTPIVVEGRLWGVMSAGSTREQQPLPPDTEEHLARFTDLAATAIANAQARAELAASRARIVATADETRRRIERDLHDGAQQQLVTLALTLRSVEREVAPEREEVRETLAQVAEGLTSVLGELREMSQGLHPAILSRAGLGPALRTLARRSPVPVALDIHGERRLPERVEVAAYYVVSEALANATKHAHASEVRVDLVAEAGSVWLSISDDGVGGADPARGSGLIGLRDRVEALGGTIQIESSAGSGTTLVVTLPLDDGPALA